MSASSLNPTRYWVHYTNDERQLIKGYYNDIAYKEQDVPTPCLELTEEEWEAAVSSGVTHVINDELHIGDNRITIFEEETGKIISTPFWNEAVELKTGESVYSHSTGNEATQYVLDGAMIDRPETPITVNMSAVNTNQIVTLSNLTPGTTLSLYAKSENMINVYLLQDAYDNGEPYASFTIEEETIELEWPAPGIIELCINGIFPMQDYTTTIEVS